MPKALTFDRYGGPEVAALVDWPAPQPAAGQLLVRVRAAGVNPVDWKIRAGWLREFMPLELPAVFGREVSGVVEAVGSDVAGFAPGDAVFGSTVEGGYSELALVPAAIAARKPDALSFVAAAALPVAAGTAYDAVTQLDLGPSDTVLVTGAGGGVGIAAVQLARARGARVIGTAGAAKRARLTQLGVEHVEYGGGEVERIRELVPGGVTAIFDTVGGDALRAVAPLAADAGRIVSAADAAAAAELGGAKLARTNGTATLESLAALVVDGTLDPLVTETFPLDRRRRRPPYRFCWREKPLPRRLRATRTTPPALLAASGPGRHIQRSAGTLRNARRIARSGSSTTCGSSSKIIVARSSSE